MASRRRYLEVLHALSATHSRRKRRQVLLEVFMETDDEVLAGLLEDALAAMLRSRTNLRRTSIRNAPDIDVAALSHHCSQRIFGRITSTSLVIPQNSVDWLS
ncbi:hypothetical protein [Salinisphaera dokdonensis]|uniref:hypothetical protein n=1 Tax=Salinisphaera dokdonensis TaxID=454598 RepID=UPI00333F5D04